MIKDKKIDKNKYKLVVLTLLFLTIVSLFSIMFTSKVEFEAHGTCKVGYTGVNFHTDTSVQDYPCKYEGQDLKCFKLDTIPVIMALEDIENLECEGTTRGKIPLFMLLVR